MIPMLITSVNSSLITPDHSSSWQLSQIDCKLVGPKKVNLRVIVHDSYLTLILDPSNAYSRRESFQDLPILVETLRTKYKIEIINILELEDLIPEKFK